MTAAKARERTARRGRLLPATLRTNPAYRRLWGATFISGIGSLTTFIALPLAAYERTGSGATFAAIMAASTAGALIMTLFGGAFADRGDRRRLLLVGDVLLLLEIVAMGIAVYHGAWTACVVIAFLEAATTSAFRSASPALQRDLVPDADRVEANALTQLQMYVTTFAAPLLGAALYPLIGFSWLVAFDALTFVLSFVLLLGLRDPMAATRAAEPGQRPLSAAASVLREVGSGLKVGARDPYIRPEIVAAMIAGIGNGMFIVAIVPWLDIELGLPPSSFGVVIALVGLSGIVSAIVVTRNAARFRAEHLVLVGVTAGITGSIAFLWASPLWLLAPCLLMFGVSNVVSSIGSSTITQRRFPSQLQGRLGSLHQLGFQGCSLVGVSIAGIIAAGGGVQAPVTTFAACIITANVLFLVALAGTRRPVASDVQALLDAEAEAGEDGDDPRLAGNVVGANSDAELATGA